MGAGNAGQKILHAGELILCERFRGIEVQRPRLRIAQQRVQDRQIVAESLSACRRGDDADVRAAQGGIHRRALVQIETREPPVFKCSLQTRVEAGREGRVARGPGR
jgi:hypothetical protein